MDGGKGLFIANPPTIVKVGSLWPILINFVQNSRRVSRGVTDKQFVGTAV